MLELVGSSARTHLWGTQMLKASIKYLPSCLHSPFLSFPFLSQAILQLLDRFNTYITLVHLNRFVSLGKILPSNHHLHYQQRLYFQQSLTVSYLPAVLHQGFRYNYPRFLKFSHQSCLHILM